MVDSKDEAATTLSALIADTSSEKKPEAVKVEAPKPVIHKSDAELSPAELKIRELEDQVAKLKAAKLDDPAAEPELAVATGETGNQILIHILEDGFTAWGDIWYRGQQIKIDVPSRQYEATKDRNGYSWLSMTESDQYSRYGKLYFRHGPWPGKKYSDPRVQAVEDARKMAVAISPRF